MYELFTELSCHIKPTLLISFLLCFQLHSPITQTSLHDASTAQRTAVTDTAAVTNTNTALTPAAETITK